MKFTVLFPSRWWLKFIVSSSDAISALKSVYRSELRFFCDPPKWYEAKVLDDAGKPVLIPYEEM